MQAHLSVMFALLLCCLLAPLGSEAQEDDKWGPWGEWSPCSRTCGVGVSYQERECLEKEKPEDFCKGSKRIYRTCNIQDCPEGSRDFRLEQCEAYNNRTLDGQKYNWMPYIPTHERCVLNCMPKGKYFFMRWAEKVVDGTKCSVDSYDICVDGKCEKLGCDLILNSNANEDKCRVCNGDGENCRTHKGVNTEDGDGYKEIVVIPASATNIDIQEMAPSSNFLAISDSSRSYFLNGDYVITNPRKYTIAGTVFNYERTRFGQERIFSLGPTSIPIHIEILLLGEKNPGFSYEFSVPKSVTKLPERAQFSWRTGEFDKCSASCAGGEQKRSVYCVRDDSGEEVSKSNCDHDKKPIHKQKCNTQPCPASWFVSGWSACSMTCGRGKQVRRVHCQHVVEGGDIAMIPDEQCPGPKPITMRVCQMQKSCPEWSVSPWSKCSVSCGIGSKRRNVTCQNIDTEEVLQPESCSLAFKPKDEEKCNPGPCTVTWMASDWSECFPKCGKGMSTRMVYCVSISDKNQKYPDGLCDGSSRPISEKNCSSGALCPAMWHASQWSKCTATCGVGMQMRNVLCAKKEGSKILKILPNDQCTKEKKMNGVQKCSARPCQAGWYIYPWEPCSKTCGQGMRRRSVKCFADSIEDTEEKWCKAEDKPVSEEQCFEEECEVPTIVTTPPTQTTTAVTTKKSIPTTTAPITTTTTTVAEATTAKATQASSEITTAAEAATTGTKTTVAEVTPVTEEAVTTPSTATATTETKAEATTAVEEAETSTAKPTEETSTVATEETTTEAAKTTTEAADEATTTETAAETTAAASKPTPTTEEEETTAATEAAEETTTAAEAAATTTAAVETTTTTTTTTTEVEESTSSFTPESTTTTGTFTSTASSTSGTTTSTIPPPTTESSSSTTPPPTTEASATTTQPPTTEASATTTQPPTTEASATTTPPPTTEASATTTPPPTTEASATTTPPPTTEASATTTPPPTTEASATTTPPPTTEVSATTTPPPTTEASATTTPPPTTEASATTTPPPTTEASATTTPAPTTETSTTPAPSTTLEPSTTPTVGRIQSAKIIRAPKDIMAYVGTEVLFRCRATGYPQPYITWRKGSIPVTSLDLSRIQILPDGDLRIADITEDDGDIYTCTATNFVGPMDTKGARLAVIVPVSVSVKPKNVTAHPGDDVTITCKSRGVPKPTVEWYKNDQFLSTQGRIRVSRTNVIISQVQPSDSGYYQCRARHNYGTASGRTYLNVIKKTEPTKPPKKCEDNPAIAHCQVVRRVNYCCINYYQKACCKTCEDLLPGCNLY